MRTPRNRAERRRDGRPERPLPDLGNVSAAVREAVEDLIARNRRDIRARGATLFSDEWLDAFLEGVLVAGGFQTREHRNKVALAIRRDVLDTLAE